MSREQDRERRSAGRAARRRMRMAIAIGGAAAVSAGTGYPGMANGLGNGTGDGDPALSRGEMGAARPATFEWLAPSVRVGRNELQIARFRADRSPDELMSSVTSHWAQRRAPIQRTAEGGWLIAIQADGEWVETVRVRADDGGAAGLRIRQRLAPAADGAGAFAVERYLPRARVVNHSEQDGDGRAITTWVLVSQTDPGLLLATARTEARRNGFVEDSARPLGEGPLWLRRRGEEVVIHATPGLEGSVAVVHWSRKR